MSSCNSIIRIVFFSKSGIVLLMVLSRLCSCQVCHCRRSLFLLLSIFVISLVVYSLYISTEALQNK